MRRGDTILIMRCEIRFTGRVQGVGFRATAHRLAVPLGVIGWVRNEADGAVCLVAEAPEDVLKSYLDQIRERLGHCISDEHITIGEDTGQYPDFQIR